VHFNIVSLLVDDKSLQKIKSVNRIDKLVAITFFFSTITTSLGYCSKPLAFNLINYIFYRDDFVYNYEMPMRSAFPYDITNLWAYLFSFAMFCYRCYLVPLISVRQISKLVD
jgi:hypothetical protein